ncbi:MAG: hypothetical protein JXN62_06610, partial [Bacteroidales bacterium]|nr:hypothetical protein [Bacteroidales bacterium]
PVAFCPWYFCYLQQVKDYQPQGQDGDEKYKVSLFGKEKSSDEKVIDLPGYLKGKSNGKDIYGPQDEVKKSPFLYERDYHQTYKLTKEIHIMRLLTDSWFRENFLKEYFLLPV